MRPALAVLLAVLAFASAAVGGTPLAPRFAVRFAAIVNASSVHAKAPSRIVAIVCAGPDSRRLYQCASVNVILRSHLVWCSDWLVTPAFKVANGRASRCHTGALDRGRRFDPQARYAPTFAPPIPKPDPTAA